MRRGAAWIVIAALVAIIGMQVLWLAPAAQAEVGIAPPAPTTSFDFEGVHLRMTGAYAGSEWTVLSFSGMPPKEILGSISLRDQFGLQYPGEQAYNDDRGEIALGFKPANALTALTGLRYSLTASVFDPDTDLHPHDVWLAQGTILFGHDRVLVAPAPGALGGGTITFDSLLYGQRVVTVAFQVRGVDFVGGYDPGEVSRPWRSGIDVELVPNAGGTGQRVWVRSNVSGGVTDVRAMATLVDPGRYSLVLSREGVTLLEREIVVG